MLMDRNKEKNVGSLRCQRGVCGYMTVEAALILSTVFWVYVFMIRSFLWVYDRCVMEQDMAGIVLRCVNAREDSLEKVWQQEVGRLDTEKYLWLELQEPLLQKQGWKLQVKARGEDEVLGSCGVNYEVWSFNPTNWLRLGHRPENAAKEKGEIEK